ncbi:protein-disulfide reductase DsbD domain-containing protein [Mesobacterium sp. TK19101]|uniref:Protein-disulfide reductase DsbD domain-containing protein n=1 Tax=Mesobacterium hydrothermale TaxID=3111907 RepID=A0ABU6HJV6_9RHOB|nr:protein-disulfide reductase DsbD domain-containing protein [Mesobacterium sp. TK19101]MEC3862728.1 protein-disulfide reductase DsbD domain-containing protein [Mesobacterium sp. TK19101]
MIRRILTTLASVLALSGPALASDMLTAQLRPGWRLPNGDHMAALHLKLAPGWKTYWRAPGDAGVPPEFDWSGSGNAASVTISWPTPRVFELSGMRSIGYVQEVVLPLRVTPRGNGDIRLKGEMMLGLCKDICMPETLRITADLPADNTAPDPVIAAALASVPFTEAEAGVRNVTCDIAPAAQGLRLTARIDMPKSGGHEETVIEAGNAAIWASEPETTRQGRTLVTSADLVHLDGGAIALDRSQVRITVLGKKYAVDIQGCD